jgi:hypothetical protein
MSNQHQLLIIPTLSGNTRAVHGISDIKEQSNLYYNINGIQIKDINNTDIIYININTLKKSSNKQMMFLLGHELSHIVYGDLLHRTNRKCMIKRISKILFNLYTLEEERADIVGLLLSKINKEEAIRILLLENETIHELAYDTILSSSNSFSKKEMQIAFLEFEKSVIDRNIRKNRF